MPINDLTALGQIMRKARKEKDLTQQELSDLSHVSVKQIANIEKGKMNPPYYIKVKFHLFYRNLLDAFGYSRFLFLQ